MDHARSDADSNQLPTPTPAPVPSPAPFEPVAAAERIEALDVVRGFALLGIFLMNIEWFNRPISTLGQGMPRGLTGADWWAAWFVDYFVQGKFWTIFSLLFGMGFAVMLVKAERTGRAGPPFIRLYLRRILALAVFGALHFIFVWDGDILFSYAAGALILLFLLYGRLRPILIAAAVLVGLGALLDAEPLFGAAGGLVAAALLALYLRGERRLGWRGASIPLFSALVMGIGILVSIVAIVFWLLPDGPVEPRLPMSVFGPMLFVTGWLSWKYHKPADKRALRMAVAVYVFGGLAMTAAGVAQQFGPDPAAYAATPAAAASATAATSAASAPSATSAATPKKTRAERAAEVKAEREKRLKEQAERVVDETRIFTKGSYGDAVDWRARQFLEKAAFDAAFGIVIAGMFLIGMAFVRSGAMEDTAAHLPLFRRLVAWGLPVGIGLGLAGSLITMSHTPGDRTDGWGIARGLMMLGNLPACLGYVGLLVVLLHSGPVGARLRVLAPLGRMALTNYLMQSLICMVWFYGFGLGHWGLPRAQQLLFVVVVYLAQIAFSHWWLARFRYGPMEWLWRGFTYRQVPPFRIGPKPATAVAPAA